MLREQPAETSHEEYPDYVGSEETIKSVLGQPTSLSEISPRGEIFLDPYSLVTSAPQITRVRY